MIHVNLHGFPAFIRIFGFKSTENRPVFCQYSVQIVIGENDFGGAECFRYVW